MKAVIEQTDAKGAYIGTSVALRWVESPTIYTGQDAEDFGPIALSNRGNAHVFASFEEAGRWADGNSQHGDFVIHVVKS